MYNLTTYVIYNAQILTTKDKLLYSVYTLFTLSTYFLRHVSECLFLLGHDSLFNSTIKNTRTIYFTATHTLLHLSLAATRFLLTIQLAQTRLRFNPYPTAFPYGNGMVLHFYQQQESSTTKTVHKVNNKRLKTYV